MISRLILLLSLLSFPAFALPEGIAGPLIGSVTPKSATAWIFLPPETKASIVCIPNNANAQAREVEFRPIDNPAGKAKGVPAKADITGLEPDTNYQYVIALNKKNELSLNGSFLTPPVTGTPHKFRMVLTSCMRIGQIQKSWNLVLKEKPAVHLTVGDTQYSDTTNPTVQWEHHIRYRRVPEHARVLRHIPVYSMWDDHDYGPNNSDGTAKGKENSLQGWHQFWANPGAGTKETPGSFYRFSWGEVDIFMVDGRYHRSPDNAADDDKKRMLGDAQFAWLLDGLRTSKAKFKVIASGSTLHHSKSDGWRIYTFSRHRLIDSIRKHRIPGVVYMAGDIHSSLVWEHHESERLGYPLVEVISSGVANSKTLSFATVDFDTTQDDPSMTARVIDGTGKVVENKTWRLSQLSHK